MSRSGRICAKCVGDTWCVCGVCACDHTNFPVGLLCDGLQYLFLKKSSWNNLTDRKRVCATYQVVGGNAANSSQEKKIVDLQQQVEELKRQVRELKRQVRELKQQLAECTSASVDTDAQATEV